MEFAEGRPEILGKLSAETGAGGGRINNEGNLVDKRSPAYEQWNWNWEKGFVTVRATMVHKIWSWGLPLEACRQAPLREIGEILQEQ